jgi:hypothetical protein
MLESKKEDVAVHIPFERFIPTSMSVAKAFRHTRTAFYGARQRDIPNSGLIA